VTRALGAQHEDAVEARLFGQIAGIVFCSFLALMLQKELADLCQRHDLVIEWVDLLRDLDRLQEATIEKDGERITTRIAVAGQAASSRPPASPGHPSPLYGRFAKLFAAYGTLVTRPDSRRRKARSDGEPEQEKAMAAAFLTHPQS
jgi:hypothetical protein